MSLGRQLRERFRSPITVLGVGNPLRGDDAAGCLVAKLLSRASNLQVIDAQEAPENYFGHLAREKHGTIVFVDAVDFGMAPGSVALIEIDQMVDYQPTTHRLPLGILMRLLRQETGSDVFVLGIQPAAIAFGSSINQAVERGSAALAAVIQKASDEAHASAISDHARFNGESLS